MGLQEILHKTFYEMGNYSQLVIDLVENIEQDIEEMTKTERQARAYLLQNILDVINPVKFNDIKVLKALIKILEEWT